MATALYCSIELLFLVFAWLTLRRSHRQLPLYFAITGAFAAASLGFATALATDGFDALRLLCIASFGTLPLMFAMFSWYSRSRLKVLSGFFALLAIVVIGIGIDAFLIEPHWLQVTNYQFASPKVKHPLKIAVVSDFQTDSIGPFEATALRMITERRPDIVFMPGDYIQTMDPYQTREQIEKFRSLLHQLHFSAPKGVYAVQGNVEDGVTGWEQMLFAGLPITTFPTSRTVMSDDGISVTGLTLRDSFDTKTVIASAPGFHIVVGHAPDFSLGNINADLLIAGHTHGGQVQLPFIGPVLTMSGVPKYQAAGGMFEIKPGTRLVVTRGLGMERMDAPRLRFLCRPEIVFIDVVPAS